MENNNFYLSNSYNNNTKIIQLTKKLPIKDFLYINSNISKIILAKSSLDFTIFFKSNKIAAIEIHNNKFILTRINNENWNLVIATFLFNMNNFLNNEENIKNLSDLEKQLNDYEQKKENIEYNQLNNNIDTKIIIMSIQFELNKIFNSNSELKNFNSSFELIKINIFTKKVYIKILNSNNISEDEIKLAIISVIKKIIPKYTVIFKCNYIC